MATGSIPAGESSYVSSIAAANTVETVTAADRSRYTVVVNTGTAPIYATGDGSTPVTSGASTTVVVPAGQEAVVSNGGVYWNQASKVIPAGASAIPFGNGATEAASSSVTSSPAQPGETLPYMASGRGQMTDPGTVIKLISASAGVGYTVELAG
jgi:hypothetical protein